MFTQIQILIQEKETCRLQGEIKTRPFIHFLNTIFKIIHCNFRSLRDLKILDSQCCQMYPKIGARLNREGDFEKTGIYQNI